MNALARFPQWLYVPAGLLLFLGLFGGYFIDTFMVNLANIETMREQRVEMGSAVTSWGDCRQAHINGRNLLLQGQYSQSLPLLERGAACSDDPWVWFDLGQAQYALGDLDSAAESWKHTPEGYVQAVRQANLVAQEGDEAAQRAAWQFAAQVAPEEHAPYIQMARLVAASDPEQYQSLLQQAVQVNPNDPAAFIELGNYFKELGNVADAQPYYEQAHTLDPTNIPILINLAQNATILGDTPAAIDYWQEVALRNERRRGLAFYSIGELAYDDNNLSSALAFFRRAVDIEPESTQFMLGLANTYFQIGCQDEARVTYQEILSMTPSEEIQAESQQKLSELAVITTESVFCPGE
jgi:tetratricopeptide (TPR) repeat protein